MWKFKKRNKIIITATTAVIFIPCAQHKSINVVFVARDLCCIIIIRYCQHNSRIISIEICKAKRDDDDAQSMEITIITTHNAQQWQWPISFADEESSGQPIIAANGLLCHMFALFLTNTRKLKF